VKVVFEAENSALDLCWPLNLIAALWKSVTLESSVTLAMFSCKTNLVRIRLPFVILWYLLRLHHRLISSMYFLCAMICVQTTVTPCFPASQQEILGRCTAVG